MNILTLNKKITITVETEKATVCEKKYRVKEVNLYLGQESSLNTDKIYSGDFLMKVGIKPMVNKSRPSVIFELTEANDDYFNS